MKEDGAGAFEAMRRVLTGASGGLVVVGVKGLFLREWCGGGSERIRSDS